MMVFLFFFLHQLNVQRSSFIRSKCMNTATPVQWRWTLCFLRRFLVLLTKGKLTSISCVLNKLKGTLGHLCWDRHCSHLSSLANLMFTVSIICKLAVKNGNCFEELAERSLKLNKRQNYIMVWVIQSYIKILVLFSMFYCNCILYL